VKFAVLGPGGVGGLLAALLARSGDEVIVLANDETAGVLRRDGLRVESGRFGDFDVAVRAAETLAEPVDAVLVTVKATHLEEAVRRVPASALGDGLVVPFLNGLDHVDHLRRVYPPEHVVAATIAIETARVRPGVIRHTSPFASIELAGARVGPLAEQLKAAGFDVRTREDELAMLWDKFAFLAPVALLTTDERAPIGVIRTARRDDAVAMINEVSAVAAAEGVTIDASAQLRRLDSIPEVMETSMQRDQAAGRPLELDALGGALLRRAVKHNVPVPVTRKVVMDLQARTGQAVVA
jgi:2-dehydropantoate 2-reductase